MPIFKACIYSREHRSSCFVIAFSFFIRTSSHAFASLFRFYRIDFSLTTAWVLKVSLILSLRAIAKEVASGFVGSLS
jgi:hypothetical protein